MIYSFVRDSIYIACNLRNTSVKCRARRLSTRDGSWTVVAAMKTCGQELCRVAKNRAGARSSRTT